MFFVAPLPAVERNDPGLDPEEDPGLPELDGWVRE
jgi:hypothetical protein